jgi:hypothetical protein
VQPYTELIRLKLRVYRVRSSRERVVHNHVLHILVVRTSAGGQRRRWGIRSRGSKHNLSSRDRKSFDWRTGQAIYLSIVV